MAQNFNGMLLEENNLLGGLGPVGQIGMTVVRDELEGTHEASSDDDKSWGQSNKKAIDVQKYKTRICKNWSTSGTCGYGPRCVFAHGDVEQRRAMDPAARRRGRDEEMIPNTDLQLQLQMQQMLDFQMLQAAAQNVQQPASTGATYWVPITTAGVTAF
eukprot:TRINITY_DN13220_c1_g1_i1.p1 TRINITY_DN13220_c1_g1~~TRINITY_DN13220_c1_g1_i1.p1  ORF type:complete len:158 (+),score=42.03 TRINITY_DN13220_c1_g1_i1:59-532(+)